MLVEQVVLDENNNATLDAPPDNGGRRSVPPSKASRSDVAFPLVTPRRHTPTTSLFGIKADTCEEKGQSMGVLTIRATSTPIQAEAGSSQGWSDTGDAILTDDSPCQLSLNDLPLEVQGKILDFIFGDMHSVYTGSTSLRGKSVSSLMRHPRRKAVSDFALVSPTWRDLVQERIYRHIKIKGTRSGLKESEDFFCSHSHLTKFVRHIEFWVPVWGDKASLDDRALNPVLNPGPLVNGNNAFHDLAYFPGHERDMMGMVDPLSSSFKLCAYSATLSEIFSHIGCFFPQSRVFTLEGGHCLKSNMIRQFPKTLFPDPNQSLEKLPHIRTFAMRGAWNIIRNYEHWKTIENALPNVEEWHCGYAKPRWEADATINTILMRLPSQLRHVNISLDGMYGKDPAPLGSSPQDYRHLCENLGRVIPQLESVSFTGKICECLWTTAVAALQQQNQEAKLKHIDLVVKSCCRQRVTEVDPETGESVVYEIGSAMADDAAITNLVFIKAFERLVLRTVDALPHFPALEFVRIRYINLDSDCTLLNPYWLLQKDKVYGIWNEEIVERLSEVKPEIGYVELGDGIECPGGSHHKRSSSNPASTGTGITRDGHGDLAPATGVGSNCSLYPKSKPKSIKTSSYRIIAEARGQ